MKCQNHTWQRKTSSLTTHKDHRINDLVWKELIWLKSCFTFSLAWIVTCISFYALGLNSSDLSGNIITNYFLARIVGSCRAIYVPLTAYLNVGRRKSLSLAFLILGISLLVLAFVPKDYDNVILAFYLLGTFFAGSSMFTISKYCNLLIKSKPISWILEATKNGLNWK